jgi:hypothetical protein
MYDGKLTDKQRRMTIKKARADECDVLLMQIQSGGVGINLQEFGCCIFMSPWWTSAIMNQAIARTVRMGQKSVVRIYRLQLEAEVENITYIDRLIYAKAEEKSRLLLQFFECVDENKIMMQNKYCPEEEVELDESGIGAELDESGIGAEEEEEVEAEEEEEVELDESGIGAEEEVELDETGIEAEADTKKDIRRKPAIKAIK